MVIRGNVDSDITATLPQTLPQIGENEEREAFSLRPHPLSPPQRGGKYQKPLPSSPPKGGNRRCSFGRQGSVGRCCAASLSLLAASLSTIAPLPALSSRDTIAIESRYHSYRVAIP